MKNLKIVLGDFNAHHPLWNRDVEPNQTGKNLFNSLITLTELSLLTPNSLRTYHHVQTNSYSTLDLCFVSTQILANCSLQLGEDLGSDHEPINICIKIKPKICKIRTRGRWKFGKSESWDRWRSSLPDRSTSDSLDACMMIWAYHEKR